MMYAHFALSFPSACSGTNPMGWTREFGGDWLALEVKIRAVCEKLGIKNILLRGYDGCMAKRREIGTRDDGVIMTSGVRTTADFIDTAGAVAVRDRRAIVKSLKDDGYTVLVHTGPALTDKESLLSVVGLWQDGVDAAAIDSSGRNNSRAVEHQIEWLAYMGVTPYFEATHGKSGAPALANVRFIDDEINAGRKVSQHIEWLNDPSEEQRENPDIALAAGIAAGASTAVPYPILAKMLGVDL